MRIVRFVKIVISRSYNFIVDTENTGSLLGITVAIWALGTIVSLLFLIPETKLCNTICCVCESISLIPVFIVFSCACFSVAQEPLKEAWDKSKSTEKYELLRGSHE